MPDVKLEFPEVVNKVLEKPASTIGEKISDLIEIIFGGITYKKQELIYKRELNFQKFKKELTEMLKNDRENYEKFYKAFGMQLKHGIYTSYGMNKETLQDLLRNDLSIQKEV